MEGNMLASSLDTPDHFSWRFEPGYSSQAAQRLVVAYHHIKTGHARPDAFFEAYATVAPLLSTRMSATQRMHVHFVLGTACAADDSYEAAYKWLSEAMGAAETMHDIAALAILAYYRGLVASAVDACTQASTDFAFALGRIRAVDDAGASSERRAAEMEILMRRAFCEYFLGHLEKAQHLATDADRLATSIPTTQVALAGLDWLRAHLYRAVGEHDRALKHILRAADMYLAGGNPASIVRCLFTASEIVFDLAESFPGGPSTMGRDAYLTMGEPYARRALQVARANKDSSGEGLALLAGARYDRLRGRDGSAVSTIQMVTRTAQSLQDQSLLVHAHTALGDALTSRGEIESGLALYREAVGVVEHAETKVLALPARRALLRASEMQA
jgi:tetratricopeptide (TPR) repeat protein